MDNRDCLRALLDGKKVRLPSWVGEAHVFLSATGLIMMHYANDEEYSEPALFADFTDTWEIYTEPKPKQKFYRRRWVVWLGGAYEDCTKALPSKQEFDNYYHSVAQKSEEWEEIEI
jgi:hypothetical protein